MDWLKQIDATTQAFKNAFAGLSADELNWKPDSKTWSIAQNIDHLIVINRTYYSIIDSVRKKRYEVPWIGRIKFMVNFFGNFILKSVNPDRKKRMKTFPLWEPSSSSISGDILERFIHHQEELKSLIESSQDLIKQDKVISSPANKNIVYSLKSAFDIIVTHEQRHLAQALEVNEIRIK